LAIHVDLRGAAAPGQLRPSPNKKKSSFQRTLESSLINVAMPAFAAMTAKYETRRFLKVLNY
jgi:hypothetical protein